MALTKVITDVIDDSIRISSGSLATISGSAVSTGSFGSVNVAGMTVPNLINVSSSVSSRTSDLETDSGSFSTRVNLLEGSGSITESSASFSTRVTTTEASGALFDGTGAVTFATVDTGQGANELYDMDQNVKTDSNVTFGNVTATGTVTAEEFHTEFVSASIHYVSGSTKFGDTSDDVHSFTGSIHLTNSGSVSGSVFSTGSFGSIVVAGNAGFNEYISHNGDADTFIRLEADEINIHAGGEKMILAVEGGGGAQADKVTINDDAADVDFQVKGDNDTNLFRTDAVNDTVGIGTGSAINKLEVHGDFYATGSISGSASSTGSFGTLKLIHYGGGVGAATNTTFGQDAGNAITIGGDNVAIGKGALTAETIGDRAVAVGTNALVSQVSDSDNEDSLNVGVGHGAGYYNVTGQNNTYVGGFAGTGASGQSNSNNTAVGKSALTAITTGGTNTAVGSGAGDALTSGGENVIMGVGAASTTTAGAKMVIIGRNAAVDGNLTTNASGSIIIGYGAGSALTTGAGNTAIGYSAMINNTTGQDNTYVGFAAGSGSAADAVVRYNTGIGHKALTAIRGGDRNTAVGANAFLAVTSGLYNIAMGYNAGAKLTTGTHNVMLGDHAGYNIETSDKSVLIGQGACGGGNVTADGTVAIGYNALTDLTSGIGHVAIGHGALLEVTTGARCIAIGSGSLMNTGTNNTDDNIAIGINAMDGASGGWGGNSSANVAIGNNTMRGAFNAGHYNIAIGFSAAEKGFVGGDHNIAIGGYAMDAADGTETDNIAIGYNAMGNANNDSTQHNIVIGTEAGDAFGTAALEGTVIIGHTAGSTINSADVSYSIFIGYQAGLAITDGGQNILIGHQAGKEHETGHRNTVLGYQAMFDNGANSGPASEDDIFIGFQAGSGTWHSSASSKNVGIGNYAMIGAMNGATMNTAIGHDAYKALTTGDENVAVGALAADSYTGGSYNVSLGAYADANGTSGNSNITIGYNAQKSAADSSQQCTLGTTDIGTLRCNQTSISSLSDSRDKTNIVDIPLGLTFINSVRPVAFDWDRRDGSMSGMSDFGFVAQELKVVEDATDYADHMRIVHTDNPDKLEAAPMKMFPILVKAVQELSQQVEDLKKKVG